MCYVSLLTFPILNTALRIGAKNLGLLISTTFIIITSLSFTAKNSENDYYNCKYSCYPYCRTATGYHTANTKRYPQIVTPAHFFHIVNTSFAVFTTYYAFFNQSLLKISKSFPDSYETVILSSLNELL